VLSDEKRTQNTSDECAPTDQFCASGFRLIGTLDGAVAASERAGGLV